MAALTPLAFHLIRVQVESVGEGVTSVAVGDHVIPLYTAGWSSFTPIQRSLTTYSKNAASASSARAERPTFAAQASQSILLNDDNSNPYPSTSSRNAGQRLDDRQHQPLHREWAASPPFCANRCLYAAQKDLIFLYRRWAHRPFPSTPSSLTSRSWQSTNPRR